MQNWINEQTARGLSQFDQSLEIHHPESKEYTREAVKYLQAICETCNYLDAVKAIKWHDYLKGDLKVLDLGCGGGWLSAYFSSKEQSRKIYALDSSHGFLTNLLPGVIQEMSGVPEKIEAIEGLFCPLLFQDGELDVVLASSVLHHAENLEVLLRECRRVLKPGGYLFILNETPYSGLRHLLSSTKGFLRIFMNLSLQRYYSISPSISSSGYFYDPALGDRDYPIWYWHEAIRRSGFQLAEFLDTGLATLKARSGRSLKHFICRAS
jgi:SAM-dependent methyltransferase